MKHQTICALATSMLMSATAAFGASVVQVNLLIDTLIASFLATSSISWLYISDRFVELTNRLLVFLIRPLCQHLFSGWDRAVNFVKT